MEASTHHFHLLLLLFLLLLLLLLGFGCDGENSSGNLPRKQMETFPRGKTTPQTVQTFYKNCFKSTRASRPQNKHLPLRSPLRSEQPRRNRPEDVRQINTMGEGNDEFCQWVCEIINKSIWSEIVFPGVKISEMRRGAFVLTFSFSFSLGTSRASG